MIKPLSSLAVLLASSCLGALAWAGTFPTTGNNATDPYLIMRSSGNACGEGDSVTCTGGQGLTSNKYYSFFVEVPPSTGELRIELFDADVGLGATGEATAGRDQNTGVYDYELRFPANTVIPTRYNRGTSTGTGLALGGTNNIGCLSGTSGNADNAWCLFYAANSPAAGHWEIRMTPNGAAGQISAIGIRARDTVTGRDLNVYARSFLHIGNQSANARRSYTLANGNNVFYPYLTAGCSLRAYDFDSDNESAQVMTYTYPGPSPVLSQTFTEAASDISSNDDWNSELLLHASPVAATRYGIWRSEYISGVNSNHVEVWLSPEYINIDPATTQPQAGSFRFYFPRNDGSAPRKPIFRHSIVALVSGAATPGVSQTSRFRIGLALRNTTDYPLTFNASNLVSVTVPGNTPGQVNRNYQGNFTTDCGAVVTQPAIGGSGSLTWNPGTMAPGAACNATYEVEVTPQATGTHDLTAATVSGTTATMLDETGTPFVYGPLCQLSIQTGTNYNSVPVNLSRVESASIGSNRVQLGFETISETGSLYFRILDADEEQGPLSGSIAAVAQGDHQPTWYQQQIDAPKQGRFYIEQWETGGKSQRFGPYVVGATDGERLQQLPIDWRSIRIEQAAAPVGQRGNNQEAVLRIEQSGLYRIRYEDVLAAGIDLAGVPMNELAVLLDDQPVARGRSNGAVFGPGEYVELLVQLEPQAYYGSALNYWLLRDADAARDWPLSHWRVDPAQFLATQKHSVTLDANREYASGSVLADPWYLRRVQRTSAAPVSVSETLQLRSVDSSSGGVLRLEAWGGLDYPDAAADHALSVQVNGTTLGAVQFDGLNPLLQQFQIPAGVLLEGANQVQLTLESTPYATDRVNIEALHIDYFGPSEASAGQWTLLQQGDEGQGNGLSDRLFDQNFETAQAPTCLQAECQTYRVSGFANPPRLFRVGSDGVEQVLGAAPLGADWLLPAPSSGAVRYLAFASAPLSPQITAASATTGSNVAAQTDFLIVAHPSLISALAPLVAARQSEGLNVQVLSTDAIYAARRSARPTADVIAAHVRELAAAPGSPLRYLLLVGSDSYDYDNLLQLGSLSFVPTFYRNTHPLVRHAPTDLPYADLDGDGTPELAVGRWPVRTLAETEQMVTKTLLRSTTPHLDGALLVADRVSAEYSFAQQNAQMSLDVGYGGARTLLELDAFEASSGGTAQARTELQAAVNAGQSWVNFFGHASPQQWAASSLLSASQVQSGLFDNADAPFLLTQWGCWGAYYVMPQHDSLINRLLSQSGGAVAAIGSSALAETGPSTSLANRMLRRLDTEPRLGDAWRGALREHVLDNPAAIDVNLGTVLLGDPTLPLR